MTLSNQNVRELCTAKEWALIQASQPGAIEKLSSQQLKTHAANAQKLVAKWQDLSRSQDRSESRKSGSPNPQSRSHEKHDAFKSALAAFQARMTLSSATASNSGAKSKPTAKARSVAARSSRRATRKSLGHAAETLNKPSRVASKPAPATKSAAASDPVAAKKVAAKKPAKKAAPKSAASKLAVQRKKRSAALAAAPATQPPKAVKPPKAIKVQATPAKQASLAGKVKSTRAAIAIRTNKIAGHVSGKGKRAQGKRDARGR